jgi:hypothetical protein
MEYTVYTFKLAQQSYWLIIRTLSAQYKQKNINIGLLNHDVQQRRATGAISPLHHKLKLYHKKYMLIAQSEFSQYVTLWAEMCFTPRRKI